MKIVMINDDQKVNLYFKYGLMLAMLLIMTGVESNPRSLSHDDIQ